MTLWRGEQPLILASKSATRLTLLVHAGLPVETVVADVDERALEAEAGDIEPAKVALLLARAKALGAALALGPEIFHKPRTVETARDQLKRLSGHTHALHSAVAVAFDGTVAFDVVVSAFLTMRALSDDMLDTYLSAAGQRVLTSVGAYQLEAVGVHLFTRVDGDHFTILGLPLLQLLAFFRQQGLLP